MRYMKKYYSQIFSYLLWILLYRKDMTFRVESKRILEGWMSTRFDWYSNRTFGTSEIQYDIVFILGVINPTYIHILFTLPSFHFTASSFLLTLKCSILLSRFNLAASPFSSLVSFFSSTFDLSSHPRLHSSI